MKRSVALFAVGLITFIASGVAEAFDDQPSPTSVSTPCDIGSVNSFDETYHLDSGNQNRAYSYTVGDSCHGYNSGTRTNTEAMLYSTATWPPTLYACRYIGQNAGPQTTDTHVYWNFDNSLGPSGCTGGTNGFAVAGQHYSDESVNPISNGSNWVTFQYVI